MYGECASYWKGGRLSICISCSASHVVIVPYHDLCRPPKAIICDDSSALSGRWFRSIALTSCRKVMVWKRASITIEGATNSARMIGCGIDGLLQIILESIRIKGLSILCQSVANRRGAQKGDAYLIVGVTSVKKPYFRAGLSCMASAVIPWSTC